MTHDTAPTSHEQVADSAQPGLGRTRRLVIVFVLAIVAVGGLASGAGIGPGDVRSWVEQRLYGDPVPDVELARVVATDSSPAHAVEVLLAPTDRGSGECMLVRASRPDGAVDGPASPLSECWFDGPATAWSRPDFRIVRPSDHFGFVTEVALGTIAEQPAVVLVGAVHPKIGAITAEFGDGAQYTFNLTTDDGWFAVILPDGVADIDRVDGTLVNSVVSLELVDGEGRVVTTATPKPSGS